MKPVTLVTLLFVFTTFVGRFAHAQQKGDIIYQSQFADDTEKWLEEGTRVKWVTKDGNSALRIKEGFAQLALPIDRLRGTKISIKARIKADETSARTYSFNGIKIMVHIHMPWDDLYPQLTIPDGPFDWQEFSVPATIPLEAETADLIVGLENVTGKIWIDSIEIKIIEEAPKPPLIKPEGPAYTGHSEERLRGAMIFTDINATDLEKLASWGANHVRWQLSWFGSPNSPADTATAEQYQQWLNSALQHMDELLPLCTKLGLKVVIDIHTLPGGMSPDNTHRIFHNADWQTSFRKIWKDIARRYNGNPAIWAYDLANEPLEGVVPDNVLNWYALARETAQDIRTIDTGHAIIVEAAPQASIEGLTRMEPIPVKGIVYSIHTYMPAIFTHQDINTKASPITYPGTIQGREWNIEAMRKVLAPVRKWQQQYGTHIYIGEFSAVRWAPGQSAYYYIKDCIDLFEEAGWDWAYHAFREWNGWSVEYTEDKANQLPAVTPTERQMLLIRSFSKNKK